MGLATTAHPRADGSYQVETHAPPPRWAAMASPSPTEVAVPPTPPTPAHPYRPDAQVPRGPLRRAVRWVLLGAASGVLAGLASAAFLEALDAVTRLRLDHPALVWFLPLAGLAVGGAWMTLSVTPSAGVSSAAVVMTPRPRATRAPRYRRWWLGGLIGCFPSSVGHTPRYSSFCGPPSFRFAGEADLEHHSLCRSF